MTRPCHITELLPSSGPWTLTDHYTHVFLELRAALPPEQAEAVEAILMGPFYDGPHKASGAATQSIPPQPPAPHRYGYGDDYDSDAPMLLSCDFMEVPLPSTFSAWMQVDRPKPSGNPPPPEGLRKPAKPRRQPTVTAARSERGTATQAVAILGLKPRKLQAMSQRGEIPGAAKFGRQWTYDLAKLRHFVEQQEQACQNEKPRPAATGAGKFSGARFRSKASDSGGRLGQMIRQSQRRAAKQAKNVH